MHTEFDELIRQPVQVWASEAYHRAMSVRGRHLALGAVRASLGQTNCKRNSRPMAPFEAAAQAVKLLIRATDAELASGNRSSAQALALQAWRALGLGAPYLSLRGQTEIGEA